MQNEEQHYLEMRNIVKSFGPLIANNILFNQPR